MATSVYSINKGINRPIVFKGLKAQYISYLAVGLVALLLLFVTLYLLGIPMLICLTTTVVLTTILFLFVYRLSTRYGEHGLRKMWAYRRLPACIRCRSRKPFLLHMTENDHDTTTL